MAGALLLAAGLLLAGANQNRAERARQASAALQREMTAATAETALMPLPAETAEEPQQSVEQAAVQTEPDCLGVLELPALQLILPVLADCTPEALDKGPCRQFGSAETEDMIVAGHNFRTQFGYLDRLQTGDAVIFTDTAGSVYRYTAAACAVVEPEDTEALQNSGYPLILYTCTYGGTRRYTVFCTAQKDSKSGLHF